jgi:hypothetical protein
MEYNTNQDASSDLLDPTYFIVLSEWFKPTYDTNLQASVYI